MRRRVFFLASLLSLLLCLATVVLWVKSRPYYQARHVSSNARFYVFRSLFGIVELDVTDCISGPFPPDVPNRFTIYLLPQGREVVWKPGLKSVFGFGYRDEPLTGRFPNGYCTARTRSWSVPLWACVGVTSILPLWCLYTSLHAYRRNSPNGCRSCGYDLTGNTSGICPECGSPVPSSGPA